MALPQKTFNIRLSEELAREFDKLAKAIPGLKKGAILRALLAETLLGKTLEARVRIVTKQLLAPSSVKLPGDFHGSNAGIRTGVKEL